MSAKRPDQSSQPPRVASLVLRLRPSSGALHEQIFEGLRVQILSGALGAGVALPSSRQLASELRISRSTVVQALEALALEGYLVSRQGSATRVAPELPTPTRGEARRASPPLGPGPRLAAVGREARREAPGAPRLGRAPRAFRPGVPAIDLFPIAAWTKVAARCQARASPALLEGGDPGGNRELRQAIAAHLSASRGIRCGAEQVFITSGTQPAVEEALRLVVEPKSPVWVEDPGYLGARRAVIAVGGRPGPIRVDREGLDVEEGARRFPRARAALVTPSHQYPLGVTLNLGRRLALLRWAAAHRALVIEDDYDTEFRHRGRPQLALAGLDEHGCVAHVGTFSKTIFPGLRIGFLVVPPALVDAVSAGRAQAPAPASALDQATLAAFIADGHFARHLRKMRVAYRERAEALLAALERDCGGVLVPQPCESGMQLTALLSGSLDDRRVRDEAARRGVEAAALSSYFFGRPRGSGLVLGFGAVRPSQMRAGTQAIAQAIETTRRANRR